MLVKSSVLAALAAAPLAFAQTFTDCNPLEKSCPNDVGLNAASYSADFTQGSSAAQGWTPAAGTTINYGSKGAEFTITGAGGAPTWESDFNILFGSLEVTMQAATGTGIVSSIVLESSDLDEIDWEFLGGDFAQAQTNYFGKGDTTTYDRGRYHPVSNPQTSFHTYKIDWTPERIVFMIDGAPVRTVTYDEAKGGTRYPQTPMKIKLGSWAGGGPGSPEGTVQWAGGKTDFSAAPFTMYVKSVKITNNTPAKEYQWTDRSGSYQSIKAIGGSSNPGVINNGPTTTSAAPTTPPPTSAATSASPVKSTTKSESPTTSLITKTTKLDLPSSKPSVAPITNIPVAQNSTTASLTTTTRSSSTSGSATTPTGSGTNTSSASQPRNTGGAGSTTVFMGLLAGMAFAASLWTL